MSTRSASKATPATVIPIADLASEAFDLLEAAEINFTEPNKHDIKDPQILAKLKEHVEKLEATTRLLRKIKNQDKFQTPAVGLPLIKVTKIIRAIEKLSKNNPINFLKLERRINDLEQARIGLEELLPGNNIRACGNQLEGGLGQNNGIAAVQTLEGRFSVIADKNQAKNSGMQNNGVMQGEAFGKFFSMGPR